MAIATTTTTTGFPDRYTRLSAARGLPDCSLHVQFCSVQKLCLCRSLSLSTWNFLSLELRLERLFSFPLTLFRKHLETGRFINVQLQCSYVLSVYKANSKNTTCECIIK